ncbi:DNA glycosylase [Amylostereum chailletii]|nr:DNA glycosylase [Amylostereum chailletii]
MATSAPAPATARRTRSRKDARLAVSPYFPKPSTPPKQVEAVIPVRERRRSKEASERRPPFYREARRTLLAVVPAEDEAMRAEQKARLRLVPGYAPFFSQYLAAHQKLLDAKPVLIQECVRDDPWKLLVAVMFLNKTRGKYSVPIFWQLLERWPTPEAMETADEAEIADMIRCLGLQNVRAQRLIALSTLYVTNPPVPASYTGGLQSKYYRQPGTLAAQYAANFALARARRKTDKYPVITPVSHLAGSGAYAKDSYRIFCAEGDEWKRVVPEDKELVRYLKWRWAVEEGLKWPPNAEGKYERADEVYLDLLADELVKFDPYEGM